MNEERDDLWDLLGKARQPVVSPFFSRNVMREVRASNEKPGLLRRFLQNWRLIGISGATAVAMIMGLVEWRQSEAGGEEDHLLVAEQAADNPDYELIAHLDELLANQESSIWLDEESQL